MKILTDNFTAVAVLVAAFLLWVSVKPSQSGGFTPPRKLPYKRDTLLTSAEYAFFQVLKWKCDPHKYMICPKVRMEDFLIVTDKEHREKYRGYVKSRHIDFLLCDSDLHILAGIELDDSSHNGKEAKKTDQFKNDVFKQIGVPLFRIKAGRGTYEAQIDEMLSAFGGQNDVQTQE